MNQESPQIFIKYKNRYENNQLFLKKRVILNPKLRTYLSVRL